MSGMLTEQLADVNTSDRRRPSLLACAGLGIGGAVLAAETLVSGLRWPYSPTEIVTNTNGDWAADYDGPRLVVYPGMGRQSAHLPEEKNGTVLTRELAQAYPDYPIDSCTYGNWGVRVSSLAAAQARYYQKNYPRTGQTDAADQLVAGHSMGLLTLFMGLERGIQQGVAVPHIDKCLTFSSPGSIDHTFQRELALLLTRFPTWGGMATKMLVELVAKFGDRNPAEQTRRSCARAAIKEGVGGRSPMLKLSMARLLALARRGFEPGIFADIIDETTEFDCHISSNDAVVKVWPAIFSIYSNLAEPYGASLYVHHAKDAGHANITNLLRDHVGSACNCRTTPFKGSLPSWAEQKLEEEIVAA